MFPDFEIYYEATAIKQFGTGIKTDRQNRADSQEIKLCIYGQMTFDNSTKMCPLPNGKGQSLQQILLEKLDIHMQNSEIGSVSYMIQKN